MGRYLCLCDLDGSLLTDSKKIKKKTISFIRKWNKRGNLFIFCTGRPYLGCLQFYRKLNCNVPLVTDNGAGIYYLDEKNKFFSIERNLMKEFMTSISNMTYKFYMVTSNNTGLYQNLNELPAWIIHDENPGLTLKEGTVEDYENYDVLIANLWFKEESYIEFKSIMEKYKNKLFFHDWGEFGGSYMVEIHDIHSSKGNALKYLKDYYHIDGDKTIAFGDQMNDLSMLEEASIGVAMKNSNPEVLKTIHEITTKDNNHNGVICYLKKNKLF